MPLRSVLLSMLVLSLSATAGGLLAPSRSHGAERASDVPAWLLSHVGEGTGQIARPVLEKARALYRQKSSEGAVRNPCYFAMDATRPNDRGAGGSRFYVICEAERSFRAMSAGHGSGRDLRGLADFSNGMHCAKNFGNAMGSELTTGGAYVTAETKTKFKGYYRAASGQEAPFSRSFLQFDGEGDTANARERAIGGHASMILKGVCRRKEPQSPHADPDGYVPFGKLVDYTGGRSNGCTSWSPSDADEILSIAGDRPTTLYIYPDRADVDAVAKAVAGGETLSRAGLYWNKACLTAIRAPKFWPKERLEPLLARWEQDHPAPPPQPAPLCARP